MNNYIPREINIDRSDANRLIISNSKKDIALSDYLLFFVIIFIYIFWLYSFVSMILFERYVFSSKFLSAFILLFSLAFNTKLLMSLIISLVEQQSIIITEKFIEIVKERPFFSKKYKLDRVNIRRINLEVFDSATSLLPSLILHFKFICNLFYYEVPRIKHKDDEVYIFEHFRPKVRKWIVDELNNEIK